MAKGALSSKKPRIRKTAPTVRELAEVTSAKQAKKEAKTGRLPKLPKVRVPKNPLFDRLGPVGRRVGRVLSWLMPKYFVNSWRELRQVTWTSRRETWRLTLAVFVFAVVFGALVAGVDKSLDEIFKKLVLK